MKVKRSIIAKDKFEFHIDVNPLGVPDTLPIGEFLVSNIPFDSFDLPKDEQTGAEVAGVWRLFGDALAQSKLFIPMFYNRLKFKLVFIPENENIYGRAESVLVIWLDHVAKRLFFSGTRGKWFL